MAPPAPPPVPATPAEGLLARYQRYLVTERGLGAATAGTMRVRCGRLRQGKFGKTRLLPLHPTTVTAVGSYLRLRNRLQPAPQTAAVFISPAGTRLLYCNVHATWKLLAARATARAD